MKSLGGGGGASNGLRSTNPRLLRRKEGLSVTCYLERVLVRMQLCPLDPLIYFSFSGEECIDVYIPGSVQVLKFLKLFLLLL